VTIILSLKLSLKVEEEQQKTNHKSHKMKVSEKVHCGAAAVTESTAPALADHNDDGLLTRREWGKTIARSFLLRGVKKYDK
jgi:hypothetical protein